MATSTPRFFPTAAAFRTWLARHHRSAAELLVGFYRVGTGRPTLTWSESVDQALCFGWIDGIRRRRDETSYTIRFTPRRPGSNWSAINIAKVRELERQGLMREAGRAAFARRTEARSAPYTYEQRKRLSFDPSLKRRFQGKRAAWTFFQAQPPGYRQLMTFWVMSAKREETRRSRFDRLLETSARGERIR
ncbi:MAG: YdeI/OmpD-associated family protein [Gemmatimonadales bacterium]